MQIFDRIRDKVMFKDATGRDMAWVESVCKSYKPDIVILDMGDKFARTGGFARPDEALKANAMFWAFFWEEVSLNDQTL